MFSLAALLFLKSHNLYIDVDFSKPSTEKRLCVMKNHAKVYCTWVAHGQNSGDLYATRFSNQAHSLKSSLGFMKVGESYIGKHGKSWKLIGLEPGVNDNVYNRDVVIHSAHYIGYGKTGRSWGCLAVNIRDFNKLSSYIFTGMRVFIHR